MKSHRTFCLFLIKIPLFFKVIYAITQSTIPPFTQWRRYDADRQQGMRAQLEELLQAEDISDDLKELLEKSLWEG